MADQTLTVDIKTGKNDLSKDLDKAAKQADVLNDHLSGLAPTVNEARNSLEGASDGMSKFTQRTLSFATGTLLADAFKVSINFIKNALTESIDAYAESEDAVNRLGQALKTTGSFSASAVDDLTNFASNLQATSKFNDEAVLSQISFAKSLGVTNERAKDLVQAGANLAATLGGSLEENVDKLGKTLSGSAGRLAQYIPELKSLTQEQLKAGAAADIINAKFGGAAANDLKTYSGATASLKNSFNDLQEGIGQSIVKSGLFQDSLRTLKTLIDNYNTSAAAQKAVEESNINSKAFLSKNTTQLAGDYQKIDDQIKKLTVTYDQFIGQEKFLGLAISNVGTIQLKKQIDDLVAVRAQIEEKLTVQRTSTQDKTQDKTSAPIQTTAEVDNERKKNAEILAAKAEFQLQKDTFEQANINLAIQNEALQQSAELNRLAEFNSKKVEIDAQLKQASLSTSLTDEEKKLEIQKISLDKQLALEKIKDDKSIQATKNTNKIRQDAEAARTAFEDKQAKERIQNQSDTFNKIATLSDSNNRTLAVIGKAAAITQIAIDGPQAVTKALAAFPPPFNFAAAALVGTAVAAQAAKVAGVAFESGGIVGQSGASVGADNRIASVRDGEMVLNANQQKKLFDMINNGGSGGDIIVQIDGREVARAVRNQIQGGFVLA
jgi:hypothetical protein